MLDQQILGMHAKKWGESMRPPSPSMTRPLLLHFALFLGKWSFFQKRDNIILNVLWYSIFMQKYIKQAT